MRYVAFDESGDLGFDFSKKGTSGKFSIAFLIMSNKGPISKIVKEIYKSLPSITKKNNNGILHAEHEKPITITRLLKKLADKEVMIATMLLDKQKVFIAENPNEMYTSMVISLVNRLYADGYFDKNEQVKLIASKRNTSSYLNERFSERVINDTTGAGVDVDIVKPADDKCLQAVDFVSWSFWQKYIYGDSTYVDIVAKKVIREYEMY